MPITIKPNSVKYKDPVTGAYVSVDVMGEKITHDAEAYAKGTKNGVPVTSLEPGYHDNSKYYAEQAQNIYNSIPQDYSSLASDVDDLKDDYTKLATEITIDANNYSTYPSIDNLEPNTVYGIAANLRKEMYPGLPIYGLESTIATFSNTNDTSKTSTSMIQIMAHCRNMFFIRERHNYKWESWISVIEKGDAYFIQTTIIRPFSLNKNSTVLVMGDSVAAGYPNTKDDSWAKILSDDIGFSLDNIAVNTTKFDETFEKSLRVQYTSVSNWSKYTHVIIFCGVNDAGSQTDIALFRQYVENTVSYIKEHSSAKILFILPYKVKKEIMNVVFYDSVINSVALENECSVINGHDMPIPFSGGGVASQYFNSMMTDGLHLSILGNNVFAKYVKDVLWEGGANSNEIELFNDYFDVNLLNLTIQEQTKNGLTVTIDNNGLLVAGTATANTDFVVGDFTVPSTGSYKINGQQAASNLKDSAYITINNGSTVVQTVKNVTGTFTFDKGIVYTYIVHISSGTVCGNGLLFSPLLVSLSTLFPPNVPRYNDNALAEFAKQVNNDFIKNTGSCYIEDYDDILDQSGGIFPYVVNGKELVVKAPTSTPSGAMGSIIFGDISLNNGQTYKISFDYANTSTKKVYLTLVGLKAENVVLGSVFNMAMPVQASGHFETTAIWREQYKYFRLYYSDFSSGSQCSIANLKIERVSEELNNSIASYLNEDRYISNPVFNEVSVADPTVIKADNLYRTFCTSGGAPRMLTSFDLINWTNSGNIGHPALLTAIREVVNPSGSNSVGAWAPNIIKHNGKYIMYYSAVENGNSANNCHMVALVANDPGGRWEFAAELFNANTFGISDCIDAEVIELADGSMYMFFGSTYGVYLVQLNDDGLSLDTTQTPVLIHAHSSSDAIDTKIEGVSIHFRQQASVGYYYYLFASVGNYAKGTGASNYKLTVTRSSELAGPYLDKSGNAITEAANTGTVLLTGTPSLQSPGHCSQIIHDKEGRDYILLHAYTQDSSNRSICLAEIKWGNDGWPYVDGNVIHDFVVKPTV